MRAKNLTLTRAAGLLLNMTFPLPVNILLECGVLMSECSHCYFHVRGTHHANGDNVNKLNREYVSYGGHKKRNVRDICCLCMSAWVQLGQRNHELTVKSD